MLRYHCKQQIKDQENPPQPTGKLQGSLQRSAILELINQMMILCTIHVHQWTAFTLMTNTSWLVGCSVMTAMTGSMSCALVSVSSLFNQNRQNSIVDVFDSLQVLSCMKSWL